MLLSHSIKDYLLLTYLTPGERTKNARSISLPSLRQHYLVFMATSRDKLENKVQIHQLARKALSYGEKISK